MIHTKWIFYYVLNGAGWHWEMKSDRHLFPAAPWNGDDV